MERRGNRYSCGEFCFPWTTLRGLNINGSLLQSGVADFIQTANGTGPYKLGFEYLLKTSEDPPANIVVRQSGWEVKFVGRTTYDFETGDARYSFINTGVYVGVETGYVMNGTTTYCELELDDV